MISSLRGPPESKMIATVEGKHRLSEPSPPRLGARASQAPAPAASERETVVLGIFMDADAAAAAMRRLGHALENGGGTILLSQSSLPPGGTDDSQTAASHGTAWLVAHVKRRLAGGASVVIARTEGSERQLIASRALLEAGCDTLLTHDVTSRGSDTLANQLHNPVIFP